MPFINKPGDRHIIPRAGALAGDEAAATKPLWQWLPATHEERAAREDIEAEIADHLASAAAEIVGAGCSALDAEQRARERFGNVAAIRRKCWWIQQGDQIMWRWFGIGLFLALVTAIAAVGIGGWKVQVAMADRLDRLTDELAFIHRGQEAMLARQPAETVPEIRGSAYLGDPSRPAANAELQIWNATELKLFRRVRTDGSGRFRSHSIPPGDYFVLASLLGADGKEPYSTYPLPQIVAHQVQSSPLYAYAGDELPDLSLDLLFRFGQLSLEIIAPEIEPTGTEWLDSALSGMQYIPRLTLAATKQSPQLPLDPNGDQLNVEWPWRGRAFHGPWREFFAPSPLGGTAAEPLRNYPAIWPGEYKVDVFVAGMLAPQQSNKLTVDVLGMHSMQAAISNEADTIKIEEGKRTHLRVTVPKAIADELGQMLLATGGKLHDEKGFLKILQPRPAAIDVLAGQPLLPTDYVFRPE